MPIRMCKTCGEWHDLDEPWPHAREVKTFAVGIISDSIPDLVHPADGKKYDSKSTFRKVTKAYGYQEVGTEKQQDKRAPVHQDFSRDVVEAVRKVNEGYKPSEGVWPWQNRGYNGDGWQ